VEAVATQIGRSMDRYKVVVNKSTVPVGTGEFVREVITRHQARPIDFDVVSNPEFLREGSAIEDTLRPDRIVIGAPNLQVAMTVFVLNAPIERPMIITDLPSAEVIKYASNAFLAAKISFINAIANICETAGADVSQVMKGMGLDSRIGMQFLQAGLGYGGSCFPKDVDSLIHTAASFGYDFKLLRSVVEINKERAQHLVDMMRKAARGADDRGAGAGLQAKYRRHARGQEPRGGAAARRGRSPGAGLRPGGHGQRQGADAEGRGLL
jgi:UDPglucose 6-dehydrogenase